MIVVTVTAAMILVPVVPAGAAWYDGSVCPTRTATKYSSSGSEWNTYPALLTQAKAGWSEWVKVDNPFGSGEFGWGGVTFNMRWQAMGSSGSFASTNCTGTTKDINFNADRVDEYIDGVSLGGLDMQGVSTHEWGHAYGIGHAGDEDTQAPNSGRVPTMATCLASHWTDDKRSIEQDDHSAVTRIGNVVGGYGSITPNSSFENGTAFWQKQSISSVGTYSGGVDGTPKYVVFTPSATNAALFADNRITNASGEKVKARVNYRRHDPGSSGQVKMTLKWGQVSYANSGFCNNSQTFNNQNLNSETYDGAWSTRQNKYCTVSSSWNYCTTSVFTVPSWDAADVRVVVYSQMYTGSEHVGVRLDRVRVMVQN